MKRESINYMVQSVFFTLGIFPAENYSYFYHLQKLNYTDNYKLKKQLQ